MYADPPYLLETRTSRRRYRCEYTREDHERLLALLRELPAAVILSGYPSALYEDVGAVVELLLGVRGRLHTLDHGVDSVIEAPRGRHSEKPEEAYRRIERVSPGPRLEMFARAPRDGWDVWGNEVEPAAPADRGAA